MSTFFNKPSDLVAGTTARASDINDRVDASEAGFDNVALVIDRGIKLPVGTTGDQVITESASNRAGKTVGFDASGDLVMYSPYNWKADWASATAYTLHDTVRDASTKDLYFCLENHTSGTFSTDLSASKWSLAINVAGIETAKTAAETAKTAAETAKTAAETAKTAAETAKTAAETAETNAETAETNAEDWASKTGATVDGTNYSAKYWATSADVVAVAGKATQIGLLGTTDAITDMNTLGTADVVSDMNTLGTADVVSDMNTLATADVVSDMNILGTADVVSDMNTLGTVDVVSDMNTLATSDVVSDMNTLATAAIIADLSTVSGISSKVTLVAGKATEVGLLGTTAVIADLSTVGASANIAAIGTCSANITAITTASTKASEAAASATSAANSASSATSSASTATTKATEASASASTATTKESQASASATSAASSATSASGSETVATAQAAISTAAKDAALAALDSFDDRYLGQKSSNPSLDNDGDSLVSGALYFNTTTDVMKVWDGSVWVAAYASLSGALMASNSLSDVASVSSARTNLGLGTAATAASTAFETADATILKDADIGVNVHPYDSALQSKFDAKANTSALTSGLADIQAQITIDPIAAAIIFGG